MNEPADPREHQNDGDPIREAALPEGVAAKPSPGREPNFLTVHCCAPRDGEPFFVLLGRDKQAPAAVEKWAEDREAAKPGDDKIAGARARAAEMRAYSGAPVPQPNLTTPYVPVVVDLPDGMSELVLSDTLVCWAPPDVNGVEVGYAPSEGEGEPSERIGVRWPTRELPQRAAPEPVPVGISQSDIQCLLSVAKEYGVPPDHWVAKRIEKIEAALYATPPAPVPAGEVTWWPDTARTRREANAHGGVSEHYVGLLCDCIDQARAALTAAQPGADADEVTEADVERVARTLWLLERHGGLHVRTEQEWEAMPRDAGMKEHAFALARAVLAARGDRS